MKWKSLPACQPLLGALDEADRAYSRATIKAELDRVMALGDAARKRERAVLRDMRKRWSELFAHACATMLANELRKHPIARSMRIRPEPDGSGQESFTPLGYKKGKRVDVVASRELLGLQLGISLKGLNFRDDSNGNYDKNLTGRLYEVREEMSTVHEYLPRAFMAAIFFLPVDACFDKPSASAFAHVVAELRARTGRLDSAVTAHSWRADFAAVGLYVAGEERELGYGFRRGALRFFVVGPDNPPPRYGPPKLDRTVPLEGPDGIVGAIVQAALAGSAAAVQFGEAEPGEWSRKQLPAAVPQMLLEPDEDEGEEAGD